MNPAKTQPKRHRLETLSQAETWDRNASRYRTAGWCNPCGARASWGHQLGFANVDPVGDCCLNRTLPERAGARAYRWSTTPRVLTEAERRATSEPTP